MKMLTKTIEIMNFLCNKINKWKLAQRLRLGSVRKEGDVLIPVDSNFAQFGCKFVSACAHLKTLQLERSRTQNNNCCVSYGELTDDFYKTGLLWRLDLVQTITFQ